MEEKKKKGKCLNINSFSLDEWALSLPSWE